MPPTRNGASPAPTIFCGRGGQIMILDLLQHNFEQARELYGDRWLGFTESDLQTWLERRVSKKLKSHRRPRRAAAAFSDRAGGGREVAVFGSSSCS